MAALAEHCRLLSVPVASLVLALISLLVLPARSQTMDTTVHYDVWNPIIMDGPADSSFGYSVALHSFQQQR